MNCPICSAILITGRYDDNFLKCPVLLPSNSYLARFHFGCKMSKRNELSYDIIIDNFFIWRSHWSSTTHIRGPNCLLDVPAIPIYINGNTFDISQVVKVTRNIHLL